MTGVPLRPSLPPAGDEGVTLPARPQLTVLQRILSALFVASLVGTQVLAFSALTDLRSSADAFDVRAEATTSLAGAQREVDRVAVALLDGADAKAVLEPMALADRHLSVALGFILLGDLGSSEVVNLQDKLRGVEQELRDGVAATELLPAVRVLMSDTRQTFAVFEQAFFSQLELTRSSVSSAAVMLVGMMVVTGLSGGLLAWRIRRAWESAFDRAWRDVTEATQRRSEVERTQLAQARQLQVYTRELVAANRQLQEANAIKNQFVSTVSHELRTPITAINGLASTMVTHWDRLPEEHRRDFVRRIQRQARRQERLVDDLLTMSRILAGALVTVPQPVDPVAVVREVVADLRLDVEVVGPQQVRTMVDVDHLYRIVANFLTNAEKYGEPPFRVEVLDVPEGLEIRVVDHGPGVAPAFQPYLFDEFRQASVGDVRTAQGVGLGLSIVRSLAEANGGSAFYRPGAPTGACFGVVLPLRTVADAYDDHRAHQESAAG